MQFMTFRAALFAAIAGSAAAAMIAPDTARAAVDQAVPGARSAPVSQLDPEVAQEWIPFERDPGGLIVIPVVLDGAPARALIDTGFASVVLSRAYASEHRLALEAVGGAYGVGGMTPVEQTGTISLRVGGFYQAGGAIPVVDLSSLAAHVDTPFQIVLGSSLLSMVALQIDFDQRRLRLLPSGSRPIAGVEVPIALRAEGRRIVTRIMIAGRPLAPVMLDTGSENALTLSASGWSGLKRGRTDRETDIAVAGTGGIAVHRLLTIDNALFGLPPPAPLAATVEPVGEFLDHAGMKGAIGLGLLSRYNVVLDVAAGRLILAPRSRSDPDPPKSTLGIQGVVQADRIKVIHVMGNSPAAVAGVRDGDEICAINGTSFAPRWQEGPLKDWGIAPPGTAYDLSLCSGAHIKLLTASFY